MASITFSANCTTLAVLWNWTRRASLSLPCASRSLGCQWPCLPLHQYLLVGTDHWIPETSQAMTVFPCQSCSDFYIFLLSTHQHQELSKKIVMEDELKLSMYCSCFLFRFYFCLVTVSLLTAIICLGSLNHPWALDATLFTHATDGPASLTLHV